MNTNTFLDVYDTKNHTYLAKNITAKLAAEMLYDSTQAIRDCLCKKYRLQRKYLIVKTGSEVDTDIDFKPIVEKSNDKPSIPQKVLDDWDRVRLQINPNATQIKYVEAI